MNDTRAIAAVRKLISAAQNVDRQINAVGWGVTWAELDALLAEIHERNQPSNEELEYARCDARSGQEEGRDRPAGHQADRQDQG